MRIKDITTMLEKEGTWVSRDIVTRDHILFGSDETEVTKIGVCWVATKKVILEAIKQGIHFIISHENPFYQCSTRMNTAAIISAEEKKKLLKEHDITVYRCHDVWDLIPEAGVADQWAKRLGFAFEKRVISSFYQAADITPMTTRALALHTANVLKQDGQQGVYLFGDSDKIVQRIAIGTGAATNIYQMLGFDPDAVIVSDDGINNYDAAQFAIDQNIPMIVVNHSCCEVAGIKAMAAYLNRRLPEVRSYYLDAGYHVSYFSAES